MNEKFINGEWYEEQYRTPGSIYYNIYVGQQLPLWAEQMNQHCADLAIAYTGARLDQKVLDLGSGVGNHMKALQRRGYNVWGREISHTAVELSGQKQMTCGSVVEMSCFKDKEFGLVYSAALFEHLDQTIVEKAFRECCRVGRMQAHLISQDKGHDPSHINVKTALSWAMELCAMTADCCFLIRNLLESAHPFIFVAPEDNLPYQLQRATKFPYDGGTGRTNLFVIA